MKTTVTIAQQIAELKAELAIRKGVFASWVRKGKMKMEEANARFAAMQGALQTLMHVETLQSWAGTASPEGAALAKPREVEGLNL